MKLVESLSSSSDFPPVRRCRTSFKKVHQAQDSILQNCSHSSKKTNKQTKRKNYSVLSHCTDKATFGLDWNLRSQVWWEQAQIQLPDLRLCHYDKLNWNKLRCRLLFRWSQIYIPRSSKQTELGKEFLLKSVNCLSNVV